jgi:hypothetical protein
MTQPAGATIVPPAQQPPANANDKDKIPDDLVLTLALSVKQINQLLFYLGKQPLAEVIDLFNSIQGQGNMAIQAMKLGGQLKNGEAKEPPQEPSQDPPSSRRRRN